MKILHMQYNDHYIPMVPYMPEDPLPGYGYVPYQINPMYFNNISDAFFHGTMFPELTTPYANSAQRRILP